jgi:hypothetical protein
MMLVSKSTALFAIKEWLSSLQDLACGMDAPRARQIQKGLGASI